MPFETVSIHETYELITPIGSLWRKIEATYKIENGEDEIIARDKIKSFLDESHAKYFPELPATPIKDKKLTFQDLKKELNVTSK